MTADRVDWWGRVQWDAVQAGTFCWAVLSSLLKAKFLLKAKRMCAYCLAGQCLETV